MAGGMGTDMVSVHQPTGEYMMISPAVVTVLGYTPQELLGTDPYLIMHPEDKERIWEEAHSEVIGNKKKVISESRFMRKDGRYMWMRCETIPQMDVNGKVISLLCISQDITEIVMLREQLKHKEQLVKEHQQMTDYIQAFTPVS